MMWPARISIRTRLTVLYGGMFFIAGMVLVIAGYLLMRHSLTTGVRDINAAIMLDASTLPPEKQAFWLGRLEQQRLIQQSALRGLLTSSLIATGVVGLMAAIAGWVMTGRVLRPLHHITSTARSVAERNLGERIRLRGPDDELKDLADTFDAMLERLDHAFDGQRRFVANASHELRTPLAVSRTLIQVAMGAPGASPDLSRLGTTLLDINTRQRELTDALLMLARNEFTAAQQQHVDLGALASGIASEFAAEADAAGVRLEVDAVSAVVDGDPILLDVLVRNLIRNGIRHNCPNGWARVRAGGPQPSLGSAGAWLEVINTGSRTLSAEEVRVIFEPFQRLDNDRTGDGTGLGLSLVRSIAQAHGGRVVAFPRPGGGLAVRLELPRRRPSPGA